MSEMELFGPIGGGGSGSGEQVEIEQRTITGPEETAKQITLPFTPTSNVIMFVRTGIAQFQGSLLDFEITGSTLSWNGKALDGVLKADHIICLIYRRTL